MTRAIETRRAVAPAPRVVRSEGQSGSPGRLVGYAAVFFREDNPGTSYTLYEWGPEKCVEHIMPTAFTRALAEGQDCAGLFDHRSEWILARTASKTLQLSVDAVGLRYSMDLADSALARHVCEAVRRGDVSQSSFSFIPTEVAWRESEQPDGSVLIVREIISCDIFDVSPCTYAAYEATTVALAGTTAGRSLSPARTARHSPPPALTSMERARRARQVRMAEIECALLQH